MPTEHDSWRMEDLKSLHNAPDWTGLEIEAMRKQAPDLESAVLQAAVDAPNRDLINSARRKVMRKQRDLLEASKGGKLSNEGQLLDGALTKAATALENRLDRLDANTGVAATGKKFGSGWVKADGSPVRILAAGENLVQGGFNDGPAIGEIMKAMAGRSNNGAIKAALSEGTDSAGGFTVPTRTAQEFIDRMRAQQVCVKAGARTLPLETNVTKIARIDTDPTVAWRSENGALTASDPTFSAVTFTSRSVYAVVKLSLELLEDSVNIGTVLERSLTQAMATELDRVCLFGSGTPPEPQGVFNVSGIGSVSMGTNGATPTAYTQVLSLLQALEDASTPQITAMIAAPRTKYKYAGFIDTTNQPLQAPAVVSAVPMLTTTAVPVTQTQGTSTDCSSIIAGDFSQMIIGVRQDLRLEILRERYLADNLQIAFLAHMRVDVQLEHPAAFAKLIGIRP